jgi:hypothetical protein
MASPVALVCRRIAFDIGSTTTKMAVADVQSCGRLSFLAVPDSVAFRMVSLLPLRSPISPGHAREISKNLLYVPFYECLPRAAHVLSKRSRLKKTCLLHVDPLVILSDGMPTGCGQRGRHCHPIQPPRRNSIYYSTATCP